MSYWATEQSKRDPYNVGINNNRAKLNEEIVHEMRSLGCPFSCAELAERYGVHVNTIRNAKSGKSWRHI